MRNKSVHVIIIPAAILFFYFIIQACGKSTTQPTGRRISNVTAVSNVKYGANKDWQGNTQNLLLDIFIPPVSTVQKFPLIVYIHGGGFLDGDKLDKKSLMIDFANSGFVGASINYRLGWTKSDNCTGDTTEAKEAIYRAVQDAKAAIRFLVANAEKYNIDTANIFLAGESAGAITALSTNYFTQSYANNFLPGVESKLGGLDNADNNLTVAYSIEAIASTAGCLNTPGLINAANVKPTIYMHGLLDNVIPYDSGHNYNCRNFSLCYGDYYLYNITKNLAPSVMHLDSTGTHTVYDEAFVKTNEACFFNSVMQGSANSGFFTNATTSCR